MKRLKTILWALLIVALTAAVAFAAEEGGHGEAHGNDWMNFLFRCINFVIFIAIIYFAAGKKISGLFKSRRAGIQNELSDLETRKTEAEKKLKEVEKNIADMDAERRKILDDYKAQGEALKESIVAKANAAATQIKEQAKVTASQEAKYAVEEMRAEVAEMVAAAAEKALSEKLSADEHEKLIDKYLTKVVLN